MKIVLLAPWFRTLATAWADGLRAAGHEVMVVTSPMHFDPPPAHGQDLVLDSRWRTRSGVAELRAARARIRAFGPDVVIAEIMRDPRYLAMVPRGVPLVITTHDAVAHDRANRTPFMRRLAQAVLTRRADLEVCFSDQVAGLIESGRHPIAVLPLTSEMPESLTPPFVEADGRRDFFVVGRLSAYKNIATVVAAYERHRASDAFRGDRLVIVGGGDPECDIPAHVEWQSGRFRFADLAPRLAAAKASICLYSAGSQSGVQVTSMQCGVQCVVSDVGGLAEYLPAGEAPLGVHEIEGLTTVLGELADPSVAAEGGRRAAARYRQIYSIAASAQAWEQTLAPLLRT